MDRRFALLTAFLSAITFGGVWSLTGPTASAAPSAVLPVAPIMSAPPVVSAPPILSTSPAMSGSPAVSAPPVESAASAVPAASTDRSVYYPGCDTVRAAGLAPLYAGQPGYRAEMDGDGDGIACEPRPGNGTSFFGGRRRRR